MRKIALLFLLSLGLASRAAAADCEITRIRPVFSEATPGFGRFKVEVGVKNTAAGKEKISVSCLYVGLTHPGVYFKDEPQVTKTYRVVEIGPSEEKAILFDADFVAYHPDTLGEIVISVVGTGVVRSLPLKTSFHPGSED